MALFTLYTDVIWRVKYDLNDPVNFVAMAMCATKETQSVSLHFVTLSYNKAIIISASLHVPRN